MFPNIDLTLIKIYNMHSKTKNILMTVSMKAVFEAKS